MYVVSLLSCKAILTTTKIQAVQIAHQQPHHFRVLLSVIAGFVFVGTPHSKSTNEKVWKTLSKLPKLKLRQSTKRSLGREDISRLANICERFEELEFDRPILSSYESRETPIGGTFRSKKVKVWVPEAIS